MAILHHEVVYHRLSEERLRQWQSLSTAVIGDSQGRSGCMSAVIKPLHPNRPMAGHARTVHTMVGDNSPLHAALLLCQSGDILVVDGGGVEDIAIWGGILTQAAITRGISGVVIDGGCRDKAEIGKIGFPVYCRSVSPRGPHKGFGGTIDCNVSVGGVTVRPGDVVVGDDDGVVVVPIQSEKEVMMLALERAALEQHWVRAIDTGISTTDLLNLPSSEKV